MKYAAALATAATITAILTGCSTETPTAEADNAPATQTGPAYIDAAVGTPFQISNSKGPTATVTVERIEPNPTCTSAYGTVAPPAGTNIALLLDVATTANPPTKHISDAWFQELTPNGYTKDLPTAEDLCIADRDRMTSDYQPNAKYHGWILVDVSNPASSLLMSDNWDGRPTPEVHRIPLS